PPPLRANFWAVPTPWPVGARSGDFTSSCLCVASSKPAAQPAAIVSAKNPLNSFIESPPKVGGCARQAVCHQRFRLLGWRQGLAGLGPVPLGDDVRDVRALAR